MAGAVAFRAADEPTTSRRDYWQHVVGTALGPVDLRVAGAVDVHDRLVLGELGAVRVGVLSATQPGGASRAARHIRDTDPDFCKIDILVQGHGVVAQDGREAVLRPGDFTFVDLSRPAHWAMSAIRIIAVVFPRSLVPLRRDELARMTAVPVAGDRGAGALISSLARQLPDHLDEYDDTEGIRLGTAVLDLLGAGIAARLDRADAVPPETRQRALLLRIRAFIDERLGDPELRPTTVAQAHHISLRYLHRLFETQDTTVAEWIRHRRLERCRRDLLDPAQSTRPVAAIGAHWGITNAAHFNRVFRATYGITPGECRRSAMKSRRAGEPSR
jgi:AraC-like DNA-binding protein